MLRETGIRNDGTDSFIVRFEMKGFFPQCSAYMCGYMCVCLRARKKETNRTKEYSAYKYISYYIYVNNCPSGRAGIQFRALYSHLYIEYIYYTHMYCTKLMMLVK